MNTNYLTCVIHRTGMTGKTDLRRLIIFKRNIDSIPDNFYFIDNTGAVNMRYCFISITMMIMQSVNHIQLFFSNLYRFHSVNEKFFIF
jgi:hypothetical protein